MNWKIFANREIKCGCLRLAIAAPENHGCFRLKAHTHFGRAHYSPKGLGTLSNLLSRVDFLRPIEISNLFVDVLAVIPERLFADVARANLGEVSVKIDFNRF